MVALTTDPEFNINRTEEYKLSIQVSLDGFSFTIIYPAENKLFGLSSTPVTVSSENFLSRRFNDWYNEQELLQKKWSETQIVYASNKFTLVPAAFYDYHKQRNIIEQNFGELKEYSIRDNYLPEEEANLVFSIPAPLLESFDKIFPGKIIIHPFSLLSKKIRQNFPSQNNNSLVVVSFQNNTFSLLVYSSQKMMAMNIFNFKHPNDVVYYVLSVLKSKNINPSKTKLLLAGQTTQSGKIDTALSEFFAQTEFLKSSVQYNENIFSKSVQQFIPIF